MNSEQTIYGQERVKALLASHQGHCSELVSKIVADIHNFTGNAKLSDDICLVAFTRSIDAAGWQETISFPDVPVAVNQ